MGRFDLSRFISRRRHKRGRSRIGRARRTHLRAEPLEQRALLAALVNDLGGPSGFGENSLARNDDGSTDAVTIGSVFPHGLNFFGTNQSSLFFNNNGNITFGNQQSRFTPFAITGNTGNPIIAPFFADVDTRGGEVVRTSGGRSTGSNLLHYDLDTSNGILTATWDDVGPFNSATDKLNAFQLQLIDRSDGNTAGDFDIRFIYENIEWTVGEASDTNHARAGFSSGNGTDFFELAESGNAVQMRDLVNRSNIGVPGEFRFPVRNGVVIDPPDVSFQSSTFNVNEGDGSATVILRRTGDLSAASVVRVSLDAGSTATVGEDFNDSLLAFNVRFEPTEDTATVSIPIIDDTLSEAGETINLAVSLIRDAEIVAPAMSELTIIDNDSVPTISISDVTVDEGDGIAEFSVTLSASSALPIEVQFATAGFEAIGGLDFASDSGTLTFNPGETARSVSVRIIDDRLDENDEDFTVGLSAPSNATIADGTGVGTIVDNDSAPTVSIGNVSVDEGVGIANFRVRLSAASELPVTVNFTTVEGTALNGSDYRETGAPARLTFSPGETVQTLGVQIIDDALNEPLERFEVHLTGATNATIGDSVGAGTIVDNDEPPTVSVSDAFVVENAGAINFNVNLSRPSSFPVRVRFATADQTALDGFDYVGLGTNATATFSPGETSKLIGVQILDDPIDERDETFELRITSATNAAIDDGSAIGNIGDNDPIPDVIIDDVTAGEGATASFSVSLSRPSDLPTVLTIGTVDGTAVSPNDYDGPNAQLTIPPGSTVATTTFDVEFLQDTQSETGETFTVQVVSVDSGIVNTGDTGLGTIFDATDALIIDNGDLGYATVGDWTYISGDGRGHENDFELARPEGSREVATWTFDLEQTGEYLVSVSYRDLDRLRATNAPFTVMDNGFPLATVPVNQLIAAADTLDLGTWFEDLGTFNIFSNQLVVTLSDDADDFVVADAVRVQRLGDLTDGPEIQVTSRGLDVQDDTGFVNLGNISQGSTVTETIFIANSGNQLLALVEPISLPPGISLVSAFSDLNLRPAEATSFEVQFDTSKLGPVGGQISFGHNDRNENPFNFDIQANVVSQAIIDDGDPEFSTLGTFSEISNKGFQDDFRFANSGTGSNEATWTFSISPGVYQVAATWLPFINRASDAPYSIAVDGRRVATVTVDQQLPPVGIVDQQTSFADLGTYNVFGSVLTVSLADSVTGLVIADAVRIDRIDESISDPDIRVATDGRNIVDGTGLVDFGNASVGEDVTRTFTVTNNGATPLVLRGPIRVPAGFSVAATIAKRTLLPAESTTFDLRVDTSVPAIYNGQVSFDNNDADENPFNFDVQAEVTTFTAIVDNSDGAPNYTTIGPWLAVNRNGHLNGFQYAEKGDGSTIARWQIDLPQSGTYRVSTAYRAFDNRVMDAPFTVFDGSTPLATRNVNQRLEPNDVFDQGTWFEDLGTFRVIGNELVVQLSNFSLETDPEHYLAIADAIRVERVGN